jgi:hypothetical protein
MAPIGRVNDGEPGRTAAGPNGGPRAAELLPLVRAAMARGEGPPAVLAWVRRLGERIGRRATWTRVDESHARLLATCLAVTLNVRCRAEAAGAQPGATLPSGATRTDTTADIWQPH